MQIYRNLTLAATALLALTACNEAFVPDYNTSTGFPHAVASLQNEYTGMFNRPRFDMGIFALLGDGFARNSAYYTPSEERFVTELTGQTILDDDNFGAAIWNGQYQGIKTADSLIGILPTLTQNNAPIPAANLNALKAVAQTYKALFYMYVALSHDTNGVAMQNPGQPTTGSLAPILCARDSWKEIVAMLDTAMTELNTAGASTTFNVPGSSFNLQFPPGFVQVTANAGTWMNLVLAMRGRARLEYAYAIARGPGGNAPTPTSAGAPDQNQLDSAIIDVQASGLYSSSLTPSEAIAANDIGVFHSFSSAAGDLSNPIFGDAGSIFVLEGAARQMDTAADARLLAKFVVAPALPTSVGSNSASSMAYLTNIGLSTPMPIVRNLELQFVLAEAYLGTGQLAKAAQTVDNVRTAVGLEPSALTAPVVLIHVDSVVGKTTYTDTTTYTVDQTSYASVRDFLIREMRPTLIDDGTDDEIAAIRDLGMITTDLTTWETLQSSSNHVDFHTSMENIPAVERQQRNNNFLPVCN
jgi:hypothetical protein